MSEERSFDDVLRDLAAHAHSKSDKGAAFERLVQKWLLTDPLYASQFDKVWTWDEFPFNEGLHDHGIDLVAHRAAEDEYVAVQCKFYGPDHSISKGDIDTFLSASGRSFDANGVEKRYSDRLLVSTTNNWTSTAEATIHGQNPPVTRIGLDALRNAPVDWDSLVSGGEAKRKSHKCPRPHQKDAIADVLKGFEESDRGKLIMACGSGKTYTALQIAQELTGGEGNILFLVPSISLLNQTLTEWAAECNSDFAAFAICSDSRASRRRDGDGDSATVTDTVIPATTDVARLVSAYDSAVKAGKPLRLFFSTYQSIDVIAEFQKQTDANFDLIVCDEAHRTTGVTLAGSDESAFVRVHNNDYLRADHRLYMTATPRIYQANTKAKAEQANAVLCSMDDKSLYGPEFHRLGFGAAVEKGLLSDYKVLVLAVDEDFVSSTLQNLLTNEENELSLDDAVKIVGCLNGLAKRTTNKEDKAFFADDTDPMRRAVAFNASIRNSVAFADMCQKISAELNQYDSETRPNVSLTHVDGKQNALIRGEAIDWLKDTPDDETRILTNARCLSEGIDVPALDAVMFLNPRKSMIDVIQAVGRVMRKAEGKKYGYIILPIGIPSNVPPEQALNDNSRYKIVWDVLQALRAHDDRMDAIVNKIELNKKKPGQIGIIGVGGKSGKDDTAEKVDYDEPNAHGSTSVQSTLEMYGIEDWRDNIFAKLVQKVGSKRYWETWAKDIAEITKRNIERLKEKVRDPEVAATFRAFLAELRDNLNPGISEDDAVEMLGEHIITEPVFNALFDNYKFAEKNPVSQAMDKMLACLRDDDNSDLNSMQDFYRSVRARAAGIDNAEGKQKVVIELYNSFFKNALPRQADRLGIVYTPVEIVDFILRSVAYLLHKKLGRSLGDNDVCVLDPFTGTGTFIVQLLRSGLIPHDKLENKYLNGIYANEIVLLAYYIAAVNIEETYHDLMGTDNYESFPGIVLTDTFALSESDEDRGNAFADAEFIKENSERAVHEREADITVIVGNPPYSVGQKSANDSNKNVQYDTLNKRISNTYVAASKAKLTRNVYDSYVHAFRWASDRIGNQGVIGFVTNGAFLDSSSADGLRKHLLEEFTSVYVFNLRGNQRTSGETSRKEGGKVFDSGSRTPVAITILVREKGAEKDGYIHYYDIGDYLSREDKLRIIRDLGSVENMDWMKIKPNKHNDWLNQRYSHFASLIPIATTKKGTAADNIFGNTLTLGVSSNRDAWAYNFSASDVLENMSRMVDFYNSERVRCYTAFQEDVQNHVQNHTMNIDKYRSDFFAENVDTDPTKIKWSRGLLKRLKNNQEVISPTKTCIVLYRPFCKKHLAFDRVLLEMPSTWDTLFPTPNTRNLVIGFSRPPLKNRPSVMISDTMQDLHCLEQDAGLPMYTYERVEPTLSAFAQLSLNDISERWERKEAITDETLKRFRSAYGQDVTKEDVFYYTYAVLQHPTYADKYFANLAKEDPRVPMVEGFRDYVRIGRELADLHLHYERPVDPRDVPGLTVDVRAENYRVEKMKYAKSGKETDKSTIIVNPYITVSGIPARAYDYVVNGRSAIHWILESYQVKTNKASGIVDDPNTYSENPRYILNLLVSIIALSLKTLDLIDELPEYNELQDEENA